MKLGLDLLGLIVDKSGSMAGLTKDTVDGYNNFIETQQKEPREGLMITTLFDNDVDISEITNLKTAKKMRVGSWSNTRWTGYNSGDQQPVTKDEEFIDYIASGGTALLDAVGTTINKIGNYLKNLSEDKRPENVIINIMTDGEENASREFNHTQIKEMVTHQTDKYNWKFIFMGANIDSFQAGGSIGIQAAYTMNYGATSKGTKSAYATSNNSVSYLRGMSANDPTFNIENLLVTEDQV